MPKKIEDSSVGRNVRSKAKATLRIKPPFGYYGAKQRLATRIIAMLPPHNAWVEAFCGSAAITLAKPPAPIEIINDLDGEVVNLFKLLRTTPEALTEAVALTPYAREEHALSQNRDGNLTSLERARRFLVGTMMTVNGTIASHSGFSYSSSYARGGMEARVSRWHNLPERLAQVAERLRTVRIENRDARELLKMYLERPATLVYLDPPYFARREHEYFIDANNWDFHNELLQFCCQAKCMILLSGYDTDLYNERLTPQAGWNRVEIETHTRATNGKDVVRNEVFWQNEHFVKAVKSGCVPIQLTEKEIEENKLNPIRSEIVK